MRAQEWFALALRVIGAIELLYGVGYLLDSSLLRLGYFNFPDTTPGYYIIAGIAYAVVGLYLLRGAPLLVSFAYPPGAEEKSDVDEEETNEQES